MTADESWGGLQIQCPTCRNNFTVSTGVRLSQIAPAPPVLETFAPPPSTIAATAHPRMSGLAILSFCLALITLPLNALSKVVHLPIGLLGCIPAVICGHMALSQIRYRPNLRGRGFAITGLIIGYFAIVVGLIALAFLLVRGTSHSGVRISSKPASTRTEPAEPPVTTDPSSAEIPSASVRGTVGNQSFALKNADIAGGVLTLRDAEHANEEVMIFLFIDKNEQLSGMKRIVPGGSNPPHVHLHWREDSKPKSKATTHGYALRLEFGAQTGATIPGKIYLELPESYGTKLTGTFSAKVK